MDVIVGGHSHTYLYSGKKPPSIEKPNGPYPTIYEHAIKTSNYENNETTLIVQAFALGKYIGILNLTFNDDGQIVEYSGEPILLTHNSTEGMLWLFFFFAIRQSIDPYIHYRC